MKECTCCSLPPALADFQLVPQKRPNEEQQQQQQQQQLNDVTNTSGTGISEEPVVKKRRILPPIERMVTRGVSSSRSPSAFTEVK
jgi:hypothetical protein